MSFEDIDSFRQRTKVRGGTPSDRLLFVKNRWEKVIGDSANDTSGYRSNFSKAHQAQIKFIEFMVIDDKVDENISEDDIVTVLNVRIDAITNQIKMSDGSMPSGIIDGYCFIIAELEAVVNG